MKCVAKKGKPTLILKGNVQPLNAEGIVVHQTHDKNIDDNLIYECFLKQEKYRFSKGILKSNVWL